MNALSPNTLTDRSGERLEKHNQRLLLFGRQMERMNLGIDVWVRPPAVVVEVDDGVERGQAAIVHVRCGARDLTQSGRFERAAILLVSGNAEAAIISEAPVAPGDAGVVKLLVGEVRSHVTGGAIATSAEHLQAQLLLGRESRAVAVHVTVNWRVAGQDRSHVARQGAGDRLRI